MSDEQPFLNWCEDWGEYYSTRQVGRPVGLWNDGTHPTGHHFALTQILNAHPELWNLSWSPNMRQGGFVEHLADLLDPVDAGEVVYGSSPIGRSVQASVTYNSPMVVALAAERLEALHLDVRSTTDVNPGFVEGHSAIRSSDWLNAELMRFRNFYLAAAAVDAGIVINS